MYDLQIIQERIMIIASKLGLSKNKLLQNANLNKSIFDNMKKNQIPSVDKIHIIADYLDCSVDYLLGRTDVPEVNYYKSSVKNLHKPIDEDVRLIAEPNIPETTFFIPDEDDTIT